MIYTARTQRGVLGFFLAIIVASSIMTTFHNGLLYFQIFLSIFILLSFFIKFDVKIEDRFLTYQVFLFAKPICKKVLYPNQITQVKFKRTGWNTKAAIIRVNKGFNIRIVHFYPANIFIDLMDFANKNSISISKIKDGLTLEK